LVGLFVRERVPSRLSLLAPRNDWRMEDAIPLREVEEEEGGVLGL